MALRRGRPRPAAQAVLTELCLLLQKEEQPQNHREMHLYQDPWAPSWQGPIN